MNITLHNNDNIFVTEPTVKLIAHTPNPELVITSAAKLCYANLTPTEIMNKQSEEDVEKFINNIMKIGHESILEHVTFTFAIENVSRVTETQLVRHRTGSYSVQSGRYVKRNATFYIPEDILACDIAKGIYEDALNITKDAYEKITGLLKLFFYSKDNDLNYEELLEETFMMTSLENEELENKIKKYEKKAIENARMVLPQSLRTHMVMTIDLRNLMHLISKRRCKRAQDEIQMVANQMLDCIKDIIPNVYKYIGADCETSHCKEGKMTCGKPYKNKLKGDK